MYVCIKVNADKSMKKILFRRNISVLKLNSVVYKEHNKMKIMHCLPITRVTAITFFFLQNSTLPAEILFIKI